MAEQGGSVRVLVLWPQMSGYADAAFGALSERADVVVVHRAAQPDAPFDDDQFDRYERHVWSQRPPARTRELARRLDPDVIVMSGWHGRTYRNVLADRRGRALRLLGMDNQWHGSAKQWLGRATSRWYLQPYFDAALVSGWPQADFAGRLGYPSERRLHGFCTADVTLFQEAAPGVGVAGSPRRFVFVGRLVREKGLDVLAEAYCRYRSTAGEDAWDLAVYGVGPEAQMLQGVPGVTVHGFVQPQELPPVLQSSDCLVLPSRFEPWGVVVHEAAAAGCMLITSDAVGAATSYLDPWRNGVVVPTGDIAATARALTAVSRLSDGQRREWAAHSRALAERLTPASWADSLLTFAHSWHAAKPRHRGA